MSFIGNKPYTVAIILAGGSGVRVGADRTKQKINICGVSILKRAVAPFENSSVIDEIIVVSKLGEEDFVKEETKDFKKVKNIVIGGKCRAESSIKGFLAVKREDCCVLIHDAARCLVDEKDIEKVAFATYEHGAACAVCDVTNTIKAIDGNGFIISTQNREKLKAAQTPQGFSYPVMRRAVDEFLLSGDDIEKITDDAMLAEYAGIRVICVNTSQNNIKITAKSDIDLAEYLITKG